MLTLLDESVEFYRQIKPWELKTLPFLASQRILKVDIFLIFTGTSSRIDFFIFLVQIPTGIFD
jgi:hypothetical protein